MSDIYRQAWDLVYNDDATTLVPARQPQNSASRSGSSASATASVASGANSSNTRCLSHAQHLRRDIDALKQSNESDSQQQLSADVGTQLLVRLESLAASIHHDPDASSLPQSRQQVQGSQPQPELEQPGQEQPEQTTSSAALRFPRGQGTASSSSLRTASPSPPSPPHDRRHPPATFAGDAPPLPAARQAGGSADPARKRHQPQPRCWGACCNGRRFSSNSNLVRHQRENKGKSAKLRCSFCDAQFTRSSARNAHETKRRCVPE